MQTSSSPFTQHFPLHPSILFNQHASCQRIFHQRVPLFRDYLHRAGADCCDQNLLLGHAAGSLQQSRMRVRQPMKPSRVPPLDPKEASTHTSNCTKTSLKTAASDGVLLPLILKLWLAPWPNTSIALVVCESWGFIESQWVKHDRCHPVNTVLLESVSQ